MNIDSMKVFKHVKLRHLIAWLGQYSNDCDSFRFIRSFPRLSIGLVADYYKREVAREIALERIVLETDAPYLVPRKV